MYEPDPRDPDVPRGATSRPRVNRVNMTNGVHGRLARSRDEVLASRLRVIGIGTARARPTWTSHLALAQGAGYIVSGLWPVVHPASFQALMGPKPDMGLVQMVGLLAAVIGLVMLVARRRHRIGPEIVLLALASALAIGAMDVVQASRGRIPPIHFVDAALQLALAGGWAFATVTSRRRHAVLRFGRPEFGRRSG